MMYMIWLEAKAFTFCYGNMYPYIISIIFHMGYYAFV